MRPTRPESKITMHQRSEWVIAFFNSSIAAREAEHALRALAKTLPGLKPGNSALVTRTGDNHIVTEQRGDVPPARGAVFGLVAGALLSAVLLAPVASLWVVLGTLAAPTLEGVAITDIAITAALLAALVSGAVVLLGILGGALLGAIAAAIINLGFASRDLRHIGTDLHIGQAALVLRVRPANVAPIVAELALRGGTPMQRAPAPPTIETDDPATTTAAQFTQQSHTGTDHAHRQYVPAPLPAPLIDPRQQDMVVGLFDTLSQARAARRALRWRWPWQARRVTGNIALISRTEAGRITYHQTENVTAGRGALFGLLTGGVLGVLLGGMLGMVLGLLFAADQVTNADAETVTGLVLGFGIGFALMAGLFGAGAGLLIGALTAGLVNLSFATADLRRIGQSLPAGKAMLVMLVPHYAADPLVETIRQRSGTLLHTPQPPADLLEDDAEAIRAQAAANTATDDTAPDTQRLIPTRAGVRIFADWRRRDGPTIVLLHGAGGDHLAWQVQYPALHAAGYSTLALDLRGHGYSDRPTRAEDYRLERFAEDVADVLDALAIDTFIMVGHCFGGMVTTMFHRLNPTASRGYMLLDTAAKAPPLAAQVSTRAPWLLHIVGHLLELLPGQRRRLFHADMQVFKGGGDIAPLRLLSDASHTTLRAWLLVYQGIAQYNGVEALESMTQPVWVIVGEDDTVFTVEDSQEIQRHVPGSKLITVPGANHIIVVNNPEVVERLILDFIADCGVFAEEQVPAGS